MGKRSIGMRRKDDHRIKETDGGDGLTKAIGRGGSGLKWGH